MDGLMFNDGELRLALEAVARGMLKTTEAEAEESSKRTPVQQSGQLPPNRHSNAVATDHRRQPWPSAQPRAGVAALSVSSTTTLMTRSRCSKGRSLATSRSTRTLCSTTSGAGAGV